MTLNPESTSMKHNDPIDPKEIVKKISSDRKRTNLFKKYEQKTLVFLVQRIPLWITSDMLTFIGFLGSLTIMLGFILAAFIHRNYLLLGIAGYVINWFGDSLDGRLAYYRQKSRKWYGFSLDITTDWISAIVMGTGFIIYVEDYWEIIGFVFVVLYGWAMITTLVRYKITGEYSIDSGLFGPTEARILISAVLSTEVLIKDSILYSAVFACLALLLINIIDTIKLLKLADNRDISEKREREIRKNQD